MELKIKEFRLKKGINQEKMAELLEITQGAYSKIENGKIDCTLTMLCKISNILDVCQQELFCCGCQNCKKCKKALL